MIRLTVLSMKYSRATCPVGKLAAAPKLKRDRNASTILL